MRLLTTAPIVAGLLFLSLFFHISPVQAQVFVDQNAVGANDGSSWANAYQDLQTALTLTSGGEIWVADGTYKPVNCNPCSDAQREMAFRVPPDVQLYGGFAGNESGIAERDLSANQTILSGDIGVVNDSLDNSYNVLIAVNSTVSNVLDGFIIEEGNADGSFGFAAGGGLFLDGNPGGTADMQIRNCTFRNNYAGGGGALAIDCVLGGVSRSVIRDCVFEGNTASLGITSTGAAIFMQGNSGARLLPRIVSCTFRNNYCGNDGGAISATPTGQGSVLAMEVDSCLFTQNRADDRGAGIWYRMSSFGECRVMIRNSRFIENESGGEGAAVYARSSFDNIANDTIANCLFSRNRTDGSSTINEGEGGAVFIRGSQQGTRNQLIVNCVFDQNTASHRGGAVAITSVDFTPGVSNTRILNCSFYGNRTEGEGGALYTRDSTGTNTVSIANSIFWADTAAVGGMEIFNDRATVSLTNCNLAGGIAAGLIDGGNLWDTDPLYADPENGDLHLPSCSPLIDQGDNGAVPGGIDLDLDGDPRIHSGTVDMGAYELGVIYVDQAAGGANNGRSWANAFNRFEDGLAVASAGDQIWVAAGTYRPNDCSPCTEADREVAFRLVPDVEAYGGFAGNETELDQRDWEAQLTILSGDIGLLNDSLDNTYSVLIAENSTEKTILDGFMIEEGNADGSFGAAAGGGLYMDANPGGTANMQVRNCTFRNNYAGGGGGIAIDCVLGGESKAEIRNCIFEGNTASLGITSTGAAIFMQGNSGAQVMPRIVNTVFRNNYCGNDGGAISATPTGQGSVLAMEVDSCLFTQNHADDRGAGIWYRMSNFGETRVVIKNSQFLENIAGGEGGAIYARSSFDNVANDTLINCLFSQNISDGSSTINDGKGGAVFLRGSQAGTRNQAIINCVFDRNSAALLGGAIATTSIDFAAGTCNADIVNCSFSGNNTPGDGGAIHAEASDGVHILNLRNSILWNDQAGGTGREIQNIDASVTIENTLIGGGVPDGINDGGNNLDIDPQFKDAINGDLRPGPCSPAIDAGANELLPADLVDIDTDGDRAERVSVDLDGLDRVFQGVVDLGAYEFDGSEPALTINKNITNESCSGACDGEVIVVPDGGQAGYIFNWSNGSETPKLESLCAGTYYVTVNDASTCTLVDSIVIEPGGALGLMVSEDVSVCPGETTELSAAATGGLGILTYDWDQELGSGNVKSVSPQLTTTYSVTVSDFNNCTETDSITVSVLAIPEPDINGSTALCPGSSTVLDAGEFATYDWSTGADTREVEVDAPGIYSITVTDDNNCAAMAELEIVEADSLEIDISGNLSFCPGDSTVLDAGSFSTYQWSTAASEREIRVDAPGSYSVTVTDAAGCSGAATVVAVELPTPTPSITGSQSICPGGSTMLDAGDFSTYVWSTGEQTQQISVDTPGTYQLTVTDENACTGSAVIELVAADSLSISIQGSATFCAGSSTFLEGETGFATYEWSTGATEAGISVSEPGSYSLTVTDNLGCSGSAALNVTESASLMPSIAGNLSICPGTGTTLDAGTFTDYAWSNGAADQEVFVSEPGTYTVTVTDGSGCTGTATAEVVRADSLMAAIQGSATFCTGSSTVLAAGSGFTAYQWSTGSADTTITVSEAGVYSLTVTDDSGCSGSASISISESASLSPVISGRLTFCEGDSSTIGVDNFATYAWSTGDTSQQLTITAGGIYQVTVSDGDGCTGSTQVSAQVQSAPEVQISGLTTFCPGDSTLLDAGAGYSSYDWSDGATTQSIVVRSEGTYTVTVSDEVGCTASSELLISFDLPGEALAGPDLGGCADTLDLMANLPPGTTGLWTSNDTMLTILDASAGATRVTDLSGMPVTLTWTLSTQDCPNYSSDELNISPGQGPLAGDDQAIMTASERSVTVNLLANDQLYGTDSPNITLLSEPSIGMVVGLENGVLTYFAPEGASGTVSIIYELCSTACPCSTATLTIEIEAGAIEETEVSNTITPNGDGFNETFVFDLIRNTPPEAAPDNELIIFNRWGDIVFQMENYDNNWNGVNSKGEDLPEATYYYILRVNIGEGTIIRGDITIIR